MTERALFEGLHTTTSDFYPGSRSWAKLFSRLTPFKADDEENRIQLNVSNIRVAISLESLLSIRCPIKHTNRLEWTENQLVRCQSDIKSGDFTARTLADLKLLVSAPVAKLVFFLTFNFSSSFPLLH